MSSTGIAVVTGGSRGIGLAAAIELAREGWEVVNADLEPGGAARFVRTDVSDRASVEQLFAGLPRVDVLVNNAARSIRSPFLEVSVEDVERVWAVALWGVFHCSQVAARRMVHQGTGGSIVVVSSVHAERAYPNSTAYNGAKAAVNHMARTWAAELAPHRIRVNCVEPGWTDTPGERSYFSEQQIQEQGARLPWGRLAEPAEIASAIGFLASPRASYITGSVLRVDGGFTLP
ncbi:MAG: SDR family oxidoreductase [Bryobacteraceae bacterium]|nr:SDR family oxidoreductase [Bryobacteraceae bacterium]